VVVSAKGSKGHGAPEPGGTVNPYAHAGGETDAGGSIDRTA
jgi:hypothetical protein